MSRCATYGPMPVQPRVLLAGQEAIVGDLQRRFARAPFIGTRLNAMADALGGIDRKVSRVVATETRRLRITRTLLRRCRADLAQERSSHAATKRALAEDQEALEVSQREAEQAMEQAAANAAEVVELRVAAAQHEEEYRAHRARCDERIKELEGRLETARIAAGQEKNHQQVIATQLRAALQAAEHELVASQALVATREQQLHGVMETSAVAQQQLSQLQMQLRESRQYGAVFRQAAQLPTYLSQLAIAALSRLVASHLNAHELAFQASGAANFPWEQPGLAAAPFHHPVELVATLMDRAIAIITVIEGMDADTRDWWDQSVSKALEGDCEAHVRGEATDGVLAGVVAQLGMPEELVDLGLSARILADMFLPPTEDGGYSEQEEEGEGSETGSEAQA
ncbi:hypothetical protein GPECTOR_825g56 [Gonium pectorale]|uniref:Uncharacterized protein n=1 Tax=Gonium pectorale TaxID=33097 RepID=A0A150FTZ6_GONPE|nr:hypothetical protein GPECTOR_825g56 [Gonium pectorale]|eukprot:KXZ41087.1 hypothetical protein GPECTOR_825g56 [Gonium pectorale]